MKRFWTKSSVAEDGPEYGVRLDGKPLKLPGGRTLAVPFMALADGIAAEWNRAGDPFSLDQLPLTRLAATAQDRVAQARPDIIAQLVAFGMNDLLCYRAAAEPRLAAREAEDWQPWLDWASDRLGIVLKCGGGIAPIEQAPETREAFTLHLTAMSDYQLAGLGVIVPALGSLVLGLAVASGELTPADACERAHLEEFWQEEKWGTDKQTLARRAAIAKDVEDSANFIRLSRG